MTTGSLTIGIASLLLAAAMPALASDSPSQNKGSGVAEPAPRDAGQKIALEWVGEYPFFMTEKACGLNASYILLRLYDKDVDYDLLKSKIPITEKGTSLADMVDGIRLFGLNAAAVRAKPSLIDREGQLPCIVHTEGGQSELGHFYVVLNRRGPYVVVQDPTTQLIQTMDEASFLELWTGYALVIEGHDSSANHAEWLPGLQLVTAGFFIVFFVIGLWQCHRLLSVSALSSYSWRSQQDSPPSP